MAEEKGYIDIKNVTDVQAFKWFKEIINKAKNDSLNIKDEEFIAVTELIDKLEKKYINCVDYKDFMKPLMTNAQKDKYIAYLENK